MLLCRVVGKAVATHSHYDHIGGFHEFEERIAHRSEAEELAEPRGFAGLTSAYLEQQESGRPVHEWGIE